jgi:hypothetical protein
LAPESGVDGERMVAATPAGLPPAGPAGGLEGPDVAAVEDADAMWGPGSRARFRAALRRPDGRADLAGEAAGRNPGPVPELAPALGESCASG